MFSFFKKGKVLKNMALLDLRSYSAAALKQISKIECVAILILPDDADVDFNDALGNVEIKDVASIHRISRNAVLTTMNGDALIDGKNVTENKYYIVNGSCVVYNAKECAPVRIMCNGELIYEKGSNIDPISINGLSLEVNRSLEGCKSYQRDLEADALFISNLNDGDVVIAGREIKFAYDVTDEMLRKKDIYFIAGHDIICNSKEVLAYAKANFIAGHDMKTK